jgi:ABC-type lipoprotein export system ATPase subunit
MVLAAAVCDEPTGDLDREPTRDFRGLVQSLNRQHGKIIDGGARSAA